jgi:hypothetical protein
MVAMSVTPHCQQVTNALKNVSEGAWLAIGLPHALSAGIGQRHAYQEEVLDMACEALQLGRRRSEEAKAAATAALESERSNLNVCGANAEAAASEKVAAEEARHAKQAAHDHAVATIKAAKQNHAYAAATKERVVADMAKQRGKRDQATSILDGTLSMLRDGGWGDAEACEDAISAVKEFLEGLSAENALIAALPSALCLRPAERRPFDEVIVQGVIDGVTAELEKQKEIVATGIEEEEHVNAEALGLWAILDLAEAAASVTEAELAEALEVLKKAISKHSSAQEAVSTQSGVVAQREVDQEITQNTITKFDIALDALERLRNFASASTESMDDVTMADATALGADDVQMLGSVTEVAQDFGVPTVEATAVPMIACA